MYPGITAAVVALATNVVYVVSLHREGDLGSSRVQFVAASVTAAAWTRLGGLPPRRRSLAGTGLVALGLMTTG